jgi:hypothetical protein
VQENERRRLKEAYTDFADDAGATLETVFVWAGLLLAIAEGYSPGGVRRLREALEYAVQDTNDLFAAFERKLDGFRPSTREG